MTGYVKIWYLLCFALASHVEGSGSSCEDIDPTACAEMAKQNAHVCSDSILSQTACPKFCGKCPVTCYNCNTTSPDVSSCNTVTCDKNKLCMVTMTKSTTTEITSYSLGCAAETVCDGRRKRTLHSRSVQIDCCDNDLCNTPLETTTSTTSSTTVSTTTTTTPTPTSSTLTTSVITVFNPCSTNPCIHGKCINNGDNFQCSCLSGYVGQLCDKADPCSSSPCAHGTCIPLKNGSFQCRCSSGFTGQLCDHYVNPCTSNPCQHGTCSNYGNRFLCTCLSGYSGSICNIQNLEGKKFKIVVKANDKFWHFDGGHPILKAVTSIWQPSDNFVKFMFEKQVDGSYKIKSVAMPVYMYDGFGVIGAHASVLNGNDNTDDDHMRYYVSIYTQDYYTIKTKATGRYVRLDENQYVSSRYNLLDDRSLFKLVEV